jgi:hypothetical protein
MVCHEEKGYYFFTAQSSLAKNNNIAEWLEKVLGTK